MRGNWGLGTTAGVNRGGSTGYSASSSHSDRGESSHSSGFNAGRSWGESSSVNHNMGWREERDEALPVETFVGLSAGGPPSWRVTSVLIKSGKQFHTSEGRPFMGVSWPQK